MWKKGSKKKFNLTAINFILTSEQLKWANEQWLTANWISKLLNGLPFIAPLNVDAAHCSYSIWVHKLMSWDAQAHVDHGTLITPNIFSEVIDMSARCQGFSKWTRIRISHIATMLMGKKCRNIICCSIQPLSWHLANVMDSFNRWTSTLSQT